MIFKTIGATISDWWRELLTLAVANFVWFILCIPIITAAPATAAMFALARETMFRRRVAVTDMFGYMREYALRSWLLLLLLIVGLIVAVVDYLFFLQAIGGIPGLLGFSLILYITIIYLQVHFYAWAMMVLRPDLSLTATLRNGFIIAMRRPWFGLAITLLIILLLIATILLPPLFALVDVALIALLSVRGLANTVPELLDPAERQQLADFEEVDAIAAVPSQRGRDE